MSNPAAEKIDVFYDDCQRLTTGEGINEKRIQSEMNKLRKWLQKHQNETLPDNSKRKLMSTLQMYYKLREKLSHEEGYLQNLEQLIDDYLKLPEGKLVTSKSKQICLNWLDEIRRVSTTSEMKESSSGSGGSGSGGNSGSSSLLKRFLVADMNDDQTLILMSPDPNSEEYLENARIQTDIQEELLAHLINQSNEEMSSNQTIYVTVDWDSQLVVSYEISVIENNEESSNDK